ncbi:MAG: response regulator [Acidobacteriota bacterium]
MDKEKLIQRLMATYIAEVEEHVQALNRDLLALEREESQEARTALLTTLFRTAHSLKGASHSVSITLIESACHRLEEILAGLRDRRLEPRPDLIQLLFAAADGIGDAAARLRAGKELSGAPLGALLDRLDGAVCGPGATPPEHPVAAPAARLVTGAESIRIPAERLEALLMRTSELLVARRRLQLWSDELSALRDFVEHWEGEWRHVDRYFRRAMKRGGDLREYLPQGGNGGSAEGMPHRARQSVSRAGENFRKMRRELERLGDLAAGNRHVLDQAAGPIEEDVRHLRMIPFADACEGLPRVVRDLSKAAGKEVDLTIEGGAVELDRAIIERLKDPLLHLVRNAVDHGIEPSGERRGASKSPRGRIVVSAALKGARVEIVVADDGRGIDLAAIHEQVRKKRLAEPASDRDLARAVFLPGVSTSQIITKVSGRGIGLDVVKCNVESVHGTVDLEFEAGLRTRLILNVPLTLSTLRALLVRAGGQTFAFIDTNIAALLRTRPGEIHSVEGRDVVLSGDIPVPLVSLAETLGLPGGAPDRVGGRIPVVMVASGTSRAAFVVDELLAEQEIVVMSLGARLIRVRNVAGATILPSGRAALILNAADLVRSALLRTPAQSVTERLAESTLAARKQLLVVEDSVTTRSLEKSILEASGYDVLVAADGAEAWQILQEKGADLVVADIEMPRMDGFALTEAIRGSKRFRDLPVVLVTALESDKDKARGIEVGADAYLLKSAFDQRDLLRTIAQLL